MPPCFDDIDQENLGSCINTENASGVNETQVYYARYEDASAIPMPLVPGEAGYTYAKATQVSTPVVFVAGKGYSSIKIQTETGEVRHETPGNVGNKKIKQLFDFFIPKDDEATLGFVTTHLNTPMIFDVATRGGKRRRLGDANNPAYISENTATTGKTGEDERGVQFTIQTYAKIIFDSSVRALYTHPEAPAEG